MAKKRDYEEAEPDAVEAVAEPEAPVSDAPAAVAPDFMQYPMAVHKQGESRLVTNADEYEQAKADGFSDEVGG